MSKYPLHYDLCKSRYSNSLIRYLSNEFLDIQTLNELELPK